MLEVLLILLFLMTSIFSFLDKTNILQNQYYSFNRFLIYQKQHPLKLIYKLTIIALINLTYKRNKIKKIKFTKRIIRQFIIYIVLNLFNIIFLMFLKEKIYIYIIIYNLIIYWISFIVSIFIEQIILCINIKKAKNKIKQYNVKIIGITGSFGKTSCKNYIYELLKDKYQVLMTPKSYNTLNGLLLTINLYLKPYHEIFLAEIGVDKINSMNKYFKIFNFDVGLITTIGKQHLKTFKSIANIAKEKNKLLEHSLNVIINLDDPLISLPHAYKNKVTFSVRNNIDADIKLNVIKQEINNTLLELKINDCLYQTTTILLGKHNISNLAAAISVAKLLNINDDYIVNTIQYLKNVPHRLSLIYQDGLTILDDSYNSNLIGFINALDVLNNANNMKILITPGIIETNKDHYQDNLLAQKINDICDLSLLIGKPTFKDLVNKKLEFDCFLDAYKYVLKNFKNKDVTLLIENDVPDIYLK